MKQWWNWRKRGNQLDKEIQHHLQMAAEEREERGASATDARSGARREFGNVGLVKEAARDAWGWRWLHDLSADLRYGLRMLGKNPGSTATVIITLALGIGMNSMVFSFVNALLLRPPAGVTAPSQLLEVWLHNPRASGVEAYLSLTYPDYLYHRDHNQSFSGMLAFDGDPERVVWNRNGDGQILQGQLVTGNFFTLLGVNAAIGRTLSDSDDQLGHPQPVVVLSHACWTQRFAANAGIVGQSMMLNGANYAIVGVAPKGFSGLLVGMEPDFWAPATLVEQITRDSGRLNNWQAHWFFPVGRLKPGATPDAARAEASLFERQIEQGHAELKRDLDASLFSATLVPGPFRGYVKTFTALLMAVFALVLLIACANVASLLLARATARGREMAVRTALGAGKSRLVRQMLAENLLLAGLAGVGGLFLAYISIPLLLELIPQSLPIRLDLPVDWRVMMFTSGLSMACAVVFGLSPALRGARAPVAATLKEETHTGSYKKSRFRNLLIATEIAACTVLLIGAALCVRSLRNASSINPGFNTQHVLAAKLDPERLGYSDAQVANFYTALTPQVQTLSGVTSVSYANHLPLGPAREQSAVTDARTAPTDEALPIDVFRVAAGYFQTMDIALLRGREFTTQENDARRDVAVVNEALAKQLWKNSDPIGQRLRFVGSETAIEVIGLVPTGKYRTLGEDPAPAAYLAQLPPSRTLVVRTSGNPAVILDAIRQAIHAVDPNMAATDLETIQQYMTLPLFPARATGVLLGIAGFLALVLTSVGLFGVISYIVSQRTQEIGLRVALGAQGKDVVKLVMKHGVGLAGIGLLGGVGMAFAATRVLSYVLYGIAPYDPLTFGGVAFGLSAIVLLACVIPAWRAIRVDPVVALRYE